MLNDGTDHRYSTGKEESLQRRVQPLQRAKAKGISKNLACWEAGMGLTLEFTVR